jgi:predicted transcriptional regulator
MIKNDAKIRIVRVLKEYPEGLTVSRIAELANLSRLTTSKYLAIMEVEKIVKFRKIGMAKLFKLKGVQNE